MFHHTSLQCKDDNISSLVLSHSNVVSARCMYNHHWQSDFIDLAHSWRKQIGRSILQLTVTLMLQCMCLRSPLPELQKGSGGGCPGWASEAEWS